MTTKISPITAPHNYYADLVKHQKFALIPHFTLESGHQLYSVPVAYKTWGTLDESGSNCLVLCHALSGSADAEDWWQPLMGRGKAFDPRRFFIFCANMLGSPYGTASPLTINPETGRQYGPEFPRTSVRDDVRIQKMVLDQLGVSEVAAVIGGSMGGMATLEWPLCTPVGYVKNIVPITTSAYHSAWGIAWGETQRMSIYADANFKSGWYIPEPSGQPIEGLSTARMIAMLTYRSHNSFEERFSRRLATQRKQSTSVVPTGLSTPPSSSSCVGSTPLSCQNENPRESRMDPCIDQNGQAPMEFAAQSYLKYQAAKFLKRFDANCYIHLTAKMDTHDVTRGRLPIQLGLDIPIPPHKEHLEHVFKNVPPQALVISVETDVLFRAEQQVQLAEALPEAKFLNLESQDGHDGFLLEFEALSRAITCHLRERCPWFYETDLEDSIEGVRPDEIVSSVFGEAESGEF
ncbi:putative acetyl-CoA--deacetylcephalosporin C acetyltransferase precursor [Lophium mytilinum]|uniref:Putative acetyl-CoA--deacetylcephalosporin C acetyltransferase n=1 Tax=Lophium mytilinum TaxID=390894 RepID=A0A6A6R4D3_9PEZI|nr:putative acetyl-CoA--deacetylcephalosporin C acetyltransferase precursor [Lophium mytilinum]